MTTTLLATYLAGMDTLGFFVAALLLLRAWRRTDDFLFAAFSAAFALLGLNQIANALAKMQNGENVWAYLLRIFAFCLLIAAIVQKNMKAVQEK